MPRISNAIQIVEKIVEESGDAGVSIKECAFRAGYAHSYVYQLLEKLRFDRRVKRIVYSRPYAALYYASGIGVKKPDYPGAILSALRKFGANGASTHTVSKEAGVTYYAAYKTLKALERSGEVVMSGKRKGVKFKLATLDDAHIR